MTLVSFVGNMKHVHVICCIYIVMSYSFCHDIVLSYIRETVTGKLWPKLYEIKVHPMEKKLNAGTIENLCLREPFHF